MWRIYEYSQFAHITLLILLDELEKLLIKKKFIVEETINFVMTSE